MMGKNNLSALKSNMKNMSKKNVLLAVGLLALFLVSGYLSVANFARLWPFELKNEKGSSLTSPKQLEAPKPKRNITLVTPSIQQLNGVDTLVVKAKVDTTEQGDCTLNLTNDKTSLVLENSTKGIDSRTGCLDWNINADQVPNGRYDLKIEFISESKTVSILEESITIK